MLCRFEYECYHLAWRSLEEEICILSCLRGIGSCLAGCFVSLPCSLLTVCRTVCCLLAPSALFQRGTRLLLAGIAMPAVILIHLLNASCSMSCWCSNPGSRSSHASIKVLCDIGVQTANSRILGIESLPPRCFLRSHEFLDLPLAFCQVCSLLPFWIQSCVSQAIIGFITISFEGFFLPLR